MPSIRKLKFLIATCGLLLLASCGQNERTGETANWTPMQIAQAILDSQSELPPMAAILPGDELYDTYISSYYQFDAASIADGAIFCADTTSAQEIAVLRLADGADSNEAKRIFSDYCQRRIGAFTGYLPDEAALIENASIAAQGDMIALLICREPELAESVFQRAFTEPPPDDPEESTGRAAGYIDTDDNIESGESGSTESAVISRDIEITTSPFSESNPEIVPADTIEPEPTPADAADPEPKPNQTYTPPESITLSQAEQEADTSWNYDSARLLEAWRRRDWSGLAQRDQEILDICQAVIGRSGFDALSDYEKELTVHDWMVANGSYDTNRLSNLPQYQENPDNDNPYGFLTGGTGIFRGYTATFQLFMDLLGIECISVQGQSGSTREEHAWNMVRLDGEWYCVDVTWDDPVTDLPVSTQTAHRYFNVTSAFMRSTGHYWDESSVPEASGTSLAWNSGDSELST